MAGRFRPIYGNNPAPEQVYKLAGDVQPGNSGGPLLSQQGRVAGVIFAKTTSDVAVGYALTMEDLAPVAARAPSLSAAVSPGQCTRK
jgi:S1-C subfamily serine protease